MKETGLLRRVIRRAILVGVIPVAVTAIQLPTSSSSAGVRSAAQPVPQQGDPSIIGWQ